jgi:hypothetical protein
LNQAMSAYKTDAYTDWLASRSTFNDYNLS